MTMDSYHTWGKTLRDGACNLFGMRRHPNSALCSLLRVFKLMCRLLVNLALAFPLDTLVSCNKSSGAYLSSAADSRLRTYTRDANIDSGETLHSFRSSCALTLAFSGSPLADVMSHVGWSSSKTAFNYLKLADVFRAGAPADLLASAPSQSQEASRIYDDYNSLNDFVSAFPVSNSSSFKRALPPLFSLCLMASSSFQFWGV